MWERDRFVNGIISICRCLLRHYRLASLSTLPVYILAVQPADMKATGAHLGRFPPSARILVAAKLKPTRFLKTAVAIDSQTSLSVLHGTTFRYCCRAVPLISEPATCRRSVLCACKRFVSAVVPAPVQPVQPDLRCVKACKHRGLSPTSHPISARKKVLNDLLCRHLHQPSMTWRASGKTAVLSVMRRTRQLCRRTNARSPKLGATLYNAPTTTGDKVLPLGLPVRFRGFGRARTRLAIGREIGRNDCPANHMVSLRGRRALRTRTPRTPMWRVRDGTATPRNVSSGAEVLACNSAERRSAFFGGGHGVRASPSLAGRMRHVGRLHEMSARF